MLAAAMDASKRPFPGPHGKGPPLKQGPGGGGSGSAAEDLDDAINNALEHDREMEEDAPEDDFEALADDGIEIDLGESWPQLGSGCRLRK